MPTIPFDPNRRLIHVPVTNFDGRTFDFTCIFDTGAVRTGLNQSVLTDIGINWRDVNQFVRVSTVSDTISVPIVTIPLLEVFGVAFTNLPVLALPLPVGISADGVLGFDLL